MTLFEATSGQHGIWFTERAGAARTAYHMALAVRLTGELDVAALTRACEAVIRRHEPLRTALAEADGSLHVVAAAEKPPVRQVPYHPDLIRDEVTRGFDLERGPLARFVVAAESAERHLLLFVAHHLVFDGMSKDVLLRELAAAYAGASLPALAKSYREFAEAERDRIAADLPAARDFWREHWREPAEPVLPGLRRTPVAAEPGEVYEFTLGPELTAAVARTADALGVTRFELFLASLHALLHRYGNQGMPVAVDMSTRTDDFTDHVGLFVNELPVPPPEVGDVSFREYALRVRARLREIYRFRVVPVGHAVGALRPRAAICPVSVSYRRRAAEEVKFPGLDVDVEWMVFHHSARNALHLQLVESPHQIDVGLQYAPAAIDADSVRRIAGHVRTVLESVVADPDRAVVELPVLPEQEREWLARAGDGGPAFPQDLTVVDGFAAQAAATPHEVAVVAGERVVTYRELDAAVARLAGRLRERGVGAGDLVALCLGRSLETLVAALSVGRIGAAYLPLDPAHPPRRRHHILSEASPVLLLTTSARSDEGMPVPVMTLDDALAGAGTPEPVEAFPAVDPDGTAYVMYTSGSTGQPKGVVVTHRAVANLLRAMAERVGAGPDDRWLALAAPSFDMSVPELFLPLMVGARTVIVPDDMVRDGAALVRLIRERQITHMQATPSAWRMLLDSGFGTGPEAGLVGIAGAEALPLPLAREVRGRVRQLFNVYGPTEVTVWATITEFPETVSEVTIGAPLAGVRAVVLDERMQPVPVGVIGELYLGGVQVASGYLGRPELTAERFVRDPDGSGRLYRTGDLCRWSADGRLVFVGRVDDQVKLRGHRIELGEIQAALLSCPGVRQAAVALRGEGEDAQLVGYVVADGAAPSPESLRSRLAELLPAVMVPSAFVTLDELPLTPNGKLDRAALPAPPPPRSSSAAREPVETADPILEQVRAIWQDVLRIDRVEVDDDLFDLGGHSLTITRISARIQQLLGVTVPLDVFYDTPTLGEVADAVRDLVAGR